MLQGEVKIAQVGLVAADVLGRVNMIEFDAELPVRNSEGRPVDVRQYRESTVALELAQGRRRIVKGRPRADGSSERLRLRVGDRHAPQVAERTHRIGEYLGVPFGRRSRL